MPYRIVLHNNGMEEDYVRVNGQHEVSKAISTMIEGKEDWVEGDSILIFKITDVEAQNEDFWENMMADLRRK